MTLQKVSYEKLTCEHRGFTDYKDCHREESQAPPVSRGDTSSHENLADKMVLARHRNRALSSTYRRQLDLLSRQPSRRRGWGSDLSQLTTSMETLTSVDTARKLKRTHAVPTP